MAKVIHIVESLGHGAVETWLLRMLGHARARGVEADWSFYCTLQEAGPHAARARALGAEVMPSPVPIGDKAAFARALRHELARGRYDVLHAHHDLVCGFYLAAAAGLKLGRRIVHVHNADEAVLTPNPLKQFLLREPLRRIGLRLADIVAGNSNVSLDTYLAGRARRPGQDLIHYYGVDAKPFQAQVRDRAAFRRALALPPDATILLFAGRLVPEKNPLFALEVLAALARRLPHAVLVFAGTGSEENAILSHAKGLGLSQQVRMLGWRDDVAFVMAQSDWFILPRPERPMEGFGLAVVEAQLAGLRMLLSRGISDDPLLPGARFKRLALADGPLAWADAAEALLAESAPAPEAAWRALADSPMDMDRALTNLLALYS